MKRKEYTNYGTFKVTTEGDCEGRTIRDLGIYTGYIDEIAFALANKCCYKLHFTMIDPTELDLTPKRDTVTIALDIDSGTWDFKTTIEAKEYFKNLFKDRAIEVINVGNYGSCTITTHRETLEKKRR